MKYWIIYQLDRLVIWYCQKMGHFFCHSEERNHMAWKLEVDVKRMKRLGGASRSRFVQPEKNALRLIQRFRRKILA